MLLKVADDNDRTIKVGEREKMSDHVSKLKFQYLKARKQQHHQQ